MAALGTQLRPSSGGMSRLAMMQAKFQEQLMIEKESRLLEMAARQEAEREDIINRVTKTSASSLSSSMSSLNSSGAGQGRVRRMFEERRNVTGRGYHQSPKGIDRSNPLEPVAKVGGRPPVVKGSRPGRGLSVDRAPSNGESTNMPRSRSQVPLQRANRGDNRFQNTPKPPAGGRGLPTHHKSTSSLMEGHHMYNGNSRGPSPVPPSSTKSSPGPRVQPAPRRTKPPPPPRSQSNFLNVSGKAEPESNRSRSPTPTPREGSTGKGFFAKLGLNKASSEEKPSKPQPPPRSKLSVSNRAAGAPASRSSTPRQGAKTPVPDNLRQCKICERNFAPDRIEKHQQICQKAKQKAKKRKTFDPVKMRTVGTEAEKFVARGDHLKENKKIKAKKNNWRKQHEDFIKTVRAAKGVEGYVAPPIDTSDYEECPYCGRKFSVQVADRHIPKCKDITSNKVRRDAPNMKAPPRRRR